MKVNKVYLEASFVSFIIHGIIILYLLGFFYFESQYEFEHMNLPSYEVIGIIMTTLL